MLHHYIRNDNSGDHYAVGIDTTNQVVLIQIQDNGEQVRITLTPQQSIDLATLIVKNAKAILKN